MLALLIVITIGTSFTESYSDCGDREPIGRIVDIWSVDKQPVQLRRNGAIAWVAADKDVTICVGDQVRTRFRTRARVRLAPRVGNPIDVVIGVNSRIRTTGDWSGREVDVAGPPILEIVHGVIRLRGDIGRLEMPAHIQSGEALCGFEGGETLSNWDPFKRETNVIVISGHVGCSLADSTISVDAGHRLEIIRGEAQPIRPTSPLILETFERAAKSK